MCRYIIYIINSFFYMHLCYRILELVDQDHYSRLSDKQKMDR